MRMDRTEGQTERHNEDNTGFFAILRDYQKTLLLLNYLLPSSRVTTNPEKRLTKSKQTQVTGDKKQRRNTESLKCIFNV
jgi:hypothetical protein